MERPGQPTDDVTNADRDEPDAVVDDESRWLDEGGSNTQFRPAERVPVAGGVEPPRPETVVRPPASDTGGDPDGGRPSESRLGTQSVLPSKRHGAAA